MPVWTKILQLPSDDAVPLLGETEQRSHQRPSSNGSSNSHSSSPSIQGYDSPFAPSSPIAVPSNSNNDIKYLLHHDYPTTTHSTPTVSSPSGILNYDALWSDPLGGPPRSNNDEHLLMFRRAVGINLINSDPSSPVNNNNDNNNNTTTILSPFTPPPTATGIYLTILRHQHRTKRLHHAVAGLIWTCHGAQIVLGATLTCLGLASPSSSTYPSTITALGALNTAVAGVLALLKGKSVAEKLGRSEADFGQLRAWIEETDALLAMGVIGRDRKEVGRLVETAFERYNECFGREFEMEVAFDREDGEEDVGLDLDLDLDRTDDEESRGVEGSPRGR